MPETNYDDRYFALMAGALRVCAKYKPKFGQGKKGGMTLEQFQTMYLLYFFGASRIRVGKFKPVTCQISYYSWRFLPFPSSENRSR